MRQAVSIAGNLYSHHHGIFERLTRDEIMKISQIVISSDIKYAKQVHAFTGQGVAMLSSVLRSERAIEVNPKGVHREHLEHAPIHDTALLLIETRLK